MGRYDGEGGKFLLRGPEGDDGALVPGGKVARSGIKLPWAGLGQLGKARVQEHGPDGVDGVIGRGAALDEVKEPGCKLVGHDITPFQIK